MKSGKKNNSQSIVELVKEQREFERRVISKCKKQLLMA